MNLQTADWLLCSGNGRLSRRIKQYNRLMSVKGAAAEITHIALIADGGKAVFESTTLNKWAGKRGTQVNSFYEWLRNYDGSVWHRHLEFERTECFEIDFAAEIGELIDRPYENGIPGLLELMFCGIEWDWFRRTFRIDQKLRTVELHCTEASAILLQNTDLLRRVNPDTNHPVRPDKLPPYMWWEKGFVETMMRVKVYPPVLLKLSI